MFRLVRIARFRPLQRSFIIALLLAIAPRDGLAAPSAVSDWLLAPAPFIAKITTSADGRDIELANGLVRRIIRLKPNAATIAYDNLMTGDSLLRSVRPEALVDLNGKKFDVGGLVGQPIHNYLNPAWLDQMTADGKAFRCLPKVSVGRAEPRFPWRQRLGARVLRWPAGGSCTSGSYR